MLRILLPKTRLASPFQILTKAFLAASILSVATLSLSARGTAFTYQGELEQSNAPANGTFDFQFYLYAAKTGSKALAGPFTVADLEVSKGRFTTMIDFGAKPFIGGQTWLEIRLREGDSSGGYTILAPRQQLTPTPLAVHALTVADAAVGRDQLANNSVDRSKLANNSVTSDTISIDTITASNISSGAVGFSELQASAVIEDIIRDGAVTSEKIADRSITGDHLIDGIVLEGTDSRGVMTVQNTSDSGAALDVVNESTSATSPALLSEAWRGGPAIWGQSFGLNSNDRVLVLQNNTWSGTPGASGYTPNTILEVEGDGDVNADGAYNGGGADFAEAIQASADSPRNPEAGDVLIIDTGKIRSVTLSKAPNSTLVAGVYSTKPGFVGSKPEHRLDHQGYIPLAMVGIVPCKVTNENGPIEAGDLLVTSSVPGRAMAAESAEPGTLIGKALEPMKGEQDKIRILLALQ